MNTAEWRLVLVLMAICFTAHFNRVSMSVAGESRIMGEYGISTTQMGTVYSAFLLTYTLVMIPGGWLIDRRGPRFALQCVCFGSAVFVVLTGCTGIVLGPTSGLGTTTTALASLVVIRAVMGITSAPLHPASASAVAQQIPLAHRSWANGLITGAALLGVSSTYLLFGALLDISALDWPGAFIVAGLATALVGWLWTLCAPRKAEAPEVVTTPHAPARRSSTTNRWALVRENRNLMLLTGSYAAVGYFQYLFFYWMNHYFDTVLDLGKQDSRLYASIPPLAMALGMPLGGWLSDRLETRFGWRVARAGLAGVAMATSAGLLMLGIAANEPFWIVTWLSLALGVLGAAEGPFWVTAVEVGGRRGGLSAGIFNMGGNAGGMLSPVVTPWLSDTLGLGWGVGIAVGSAVGLVGALLWYWIDLEPGGDERVDSAAPETATLSPLASG